MAFSQCKNACQTILAVRWAGWEVCGAAMGCDGWTADSFSIEGC